MKKNISILFLFLFLFHTEKPFASDLQNIFKNVIEYKIEDGPRFLLYQRNHTSTVAFNIVYPYGATSDPKGKSGLMHVLEHMSFHGTNIVSGNYFGTYTKIGSNGPSATTAYDYISFKNVLPAPAIKAWFILESDKMLFPLFTNFAAELEIVKKEKYFRELSHPHKEFIKNYLNFVFAGTTQNRMPVIGTSEDLNNLKQNDVIDHFKKYFNPTNATISIVGKFDLANVLSLIEKYFGEIGKIDRNKLDFDENGYPVVKEIKELQGITFNNSPAPPLYKKEKISDLKKINKEHIYVEKSETAPVLLLSFFRPPSEKLSIESVALNVLAYFLNKEESSFRNALRKNEAIKELVVSDPEPTDNKDDLFLIITFLNPGFELNFSLLEDFIINSIKTEIINNLDESFLNKIKQKMIFEFYANKSTNLEIAQMLAKSSSHFQNLKYNGEYLELIKKVTINDLNCLIKNYFSKENIFIGRLGN
ncbi:MAG: pitrilysin family protein [Pseudomonadota bacterium]